MGSTNRISTIAKSRYRKSKAGKVYHIIGWFHYQASRTVPNTPHPASYSRSTLHQAFMKVTIEEWHAVASWRWDMPEDEVCGICRVHFDGTCPTCKYPGDDCTLCVALLHTPMSTFEANQFAVIGKCGHSFHMVSFENISTPFCLD